MLKLLSVSGALCPIIYKEQKTTLCKIVFNLKIRSEIGKLLTIKTCFVRSTAAVDSINYFEKGF